MVPLFGAAYAAPNKGITILYSFRSQKTVLNPPVNGKIQGLFNAFECFSSTFQGKFNFQGLFKSNLLYSSTFQACAKPDLIHPLLTGFFSPNLAIYEPTHDMGWKLHKQNHQFCIWRLKKCELQIVYGFF